MEIKGLKNALEKLFEQNSQIELLERVKSELTAENVRLRDESIELKSKIDEITRKMSLKEDEMKETLNSHTDELLQQISRGDVEQYKLEYEEFWKKEVRERDDIILNLLSQVDDVESCKHKEVQKLTADLDFTRGLPMQVRIKHLLCTAMEKQIEWFSKEENYRKTLQSSTTSFMERIVELERVCEEKTDIIEELRNRRRPKTVERHLKINDTEEIQLNDNLKDSASSCLDQKEKSTNKLERKPSDLKKTMESSNPDELNLLRKKIQKKNDQLNNLRRRYRQLFWQVDMSLSQLEEQHRRTTENFQQTIFNKHGDI
ncbi:hypothetical protein DICVIV_03323 [Dictyocaulus viviparus]|uniref:Uncharacterized protein n=1 Tax=Dictyocaulus viviparus TaxID=29172 RepID=A0A0D8Y302_DICVI|nr:hypothetical protein DICVIV_03323 [Dictyocaulus viviparus]